MLDWLHSIIMAGVWIIILICLIFSIASIVVGFGLFNGWLILVGFIGSSISIGTINWLTD
jgi:hypothetical protein